MIKNLFALSVTILTSLCFSNVLANHHVTSGVVSEWTDCVGESFGKMVFFIVSF